MPCYAASDLLDLHCLSMTNKKDNRLIWVKLINIFIL